MRMILHWHENYHPVEGGGPAHIENLISNLSQGYQYEIITNHIEDCPNMEIVSNNLRVHRFPHTPFFFNTKFIKKRVISYPFRLINDFQSLYTKFEYLKRIKFDILHVHGVAFYGAVLKLNHITRKKVYQKIVDFSFVKNPKLLTLHNFFPGFTNDKKIIDAYNHYIDQFDNIICVNRHIYNYCVEFCNERGYNKRIWFIPNSVDTKKFCYASPKVTGKMKIGFVGRLSHTKDLDMINLLLSKLSNETEFYLVVTGNTSLIKISKTNENRVTVLENVSQNQMPEFYHSIDILFNSTLNDGVGLATLESMACGRPVIMYKSSNRFPVINGETGYLVNQNLDDIMMVLKYAYKNLKKIKEIGLNARQIVERKFSNNVLVPRIKEIYDGLINSG